MRFMGKDWNASLSELSNTGRLVPTPDYLAAATIQSSSVLTGPSTIDGDSGRNLGVETQQEVRQRRGRKPWSLRLGRS